MRAFGQSVCFEISSGERLTPQSQHKAAAFLQCFTCFSALQLRNTLLHFEHFRNIFKNGIPTNSPFLLLLLLILRMLLLFVLLLLLLMFLLAMFLLLLFLFVFLFFLLFLFIFLFLLFIFLLFILLFLIINRLSDLG